MKSWNEVVTESKDTDKLAEVIKKLKDAKIEINYLDNDDEERKKYAPNDEELLKHNIKEGEKALEHEYDKVYFWKK